MIVNMLHSLVLAVHVVVGVVGVALGPAVLVQVARHRVGRLAEWFHAVVLAVCLSALALAALDIRSLWWLVPISAATYAFALRAHRAAQRRRPRWLASVARGYGGAYIALWTAILVVSAGSSTVAWLLPAALGAPIVEWLAFRLHRQSPVTAARHLPA